VNRILANWRGKREKVRATQCQDQAETQQRAEWLQAYYALLDCEANLRTRLGRQPLWQEMTKEYAARLCAWVGLWDSRDVSALRRLPLLSPQEEQLHPGTHEAVEVALGLVRLARLGKRHEVQDQLDRLRHDHVADARAREDIRELRRRVLLWIHFRIQDVLKNNTKAKQTPQESEPAPSPFPRSGGGLAGPTIDDEDEKILRALRKSAPLLLTQDDLQAATRVSRRTICERMKGLLQDELVARPKGLKSGTTIAEKGLALLKQIDAAKLAQ
jgi:hypothetical protein